MQNIQTLQIQNFGLIKDGFKKPIKFKRCTVFIGDQGTGKSTIAKLYSIFTWLEKSIVAKKSFKTIGISDFKKLLNQQNIPNDYFNSNTKIEYNSDILNITINKNSCSFSVENKKPKYVCPKIQYFPSERNLLSIIANLQNLSDIPEMLIQLNRILSIAKKEIKNINFQKFELIYDKTNDQQYIIDSDDKNKVKINQASSGLQSIYPLIYVSRYLKQNIDTNILERIRKSDDNRRQNFIEGIKDNRIKEFFNNYIVSGIKGKDNLDISNMESLIAAIFNSCNINIVEEPEQNLFPTSQVAILENLVRDTNGENDKLIITTHSPYILSQLNNYILADKKFKETNKKIKEIPSDCFIDYNNISAYKIVDGKIKNIMDKEFGGIDVLEIDQCSRNINNCFDKLIDLEI